MDKETAIQIQEHRESKKDQAKENYTNTPCN